MDKSRKRPPAQNETLAKKCKKLSSNSLGLALLYWDVARLIADQCTRLFLSADTDKEFFRETEHGLVPVKFWMQPRTTQKKQWLAVWTEILEKMFGKGFKAEMLTVYIGDSVIYPLLPESWGDSILCAVGDFHRLAVAGQKCVVHYFDIFRLVERCQPNSQVDEAFVFTKTANGTYQEKRYSLKENGWPKFIIMDKKWMCAPVMLWAMQAGAAAANPVTAKGTGGVCMHVSWGGVLTDGTGGGFTRTLVARYGNDTIQGRPKTIWEEAMAGTARRMILKGYKDPPLPYVSAMLQAALLTVGERVDDAQLAAMSANVRARMLHAQLG